MSIRTFLILICFSVAAFCLGFLAGYWKAVTNVQVSYLDRTPPDCLFKKTKDERVLCAWRAIK